MSHDIFNNLEPDSTDDIINSDEIDENEYKKLEKIGLKVYETNIVTKSGYRIKVIDEVGKEEYIKKHFNTLNDINKIICLSYLWNDEDEYKNKKYKYK